MSFKPWNSLALATLLAGAATTAATAQNIAAAQKAIRYERYNEARSILRGANTPEANFELGRVYQLRGLNDSAALYFRRAASTTPFGQVAEGRAFLAAGDVNAASAKFDAAAKAGKMKDVNTLALIAQAYSESDALKSPDRAVPYITAGETASKGKDNPMLMIARGDVYLKSSNGGGDAMSSYDRAITADANNAEAYYKRGVLNVRSRNATEALANLEKAIAIDPSYAPAYRALAEVYFLGGKYDKAQSYIEEYIKRAEPSTDTTVKYAAFLFQNKKYPESLVEVNKALAAEPNNFTMNRLKAYTLYETKDYAGAQAAMDQFLKIAPADKLLPVDYSYQSKILIANKRQAEAITVLQKALASTTDPAQQRDLRSDLVLAQQATNDYAGAAATQRMIAMMPGSDLTDQFRYAVSLDRAKQYTRSDSVYNIIITAKPDYLPAYLYRARANAGLDDENSSKGLAKPYFEQYIAKASATPDKYKAGLVESYDYLAAYNFNKGNKPEASANVDKALALDPADERANIIKKNLTAPVRTAPKAPVKPAPKK